MSSAKLYLDTRTVRADGTHSLKIRITHKGDFYITLKVYLTPPQWDGEKILNHPNGKTINPYVKQRLTQIENALLKLASDGRLKNINNEQLKLEIEKFVNPSYETTEVSIYTFLQHYQSFIAEKSNVRTIEIYKSTLNKIAEYADIKTLTFDQINLAWLKGFDKYLGNTAPSVNARAIHLRNVRSIFNDAINNDKIPLNIYPFRKFKIKRKDTIKRALTIEQLKLVRDGNWPSDKKENIKEAADTFMLMFYLIGINIIDLLNLTEIENGRVEYERAKTGRDYSVKITSEAKDIIERYKGEDTLLLFKSRYANYRGFTTRVNLRLKTIGEQIGVHDLTTYWARHTWATVAAGLDIPKETIAAALGHGGNSVTDIYIDFDRRKVDEANRKVIEAIK